MGSYIFCIALSFASYGLHLNQESPYFIQSLVVAKNYDRIRKAVHQCYQSIPQTIESLSFVLNF